MAREFAGGSSTNLVKTESTPILGTQRSAMIWARLDTIDTTDRRFWEQATAAVLGDNPRVNTTDFTLSVGTDGTEGSWNVTNLPPTLSWFLLLFTYDGTLTTTDPKIYYNSTLQTIASETEPIGTLDTGNHPIYIAQNTASTRCIDGRLAEFARWNRVLKVEEINALAKGYSPLFFRKNLVTYMPLIGKASPEPEVISGLRGTVTGTTTASHPRIIYPRNFR